MSREADRLRVRSEHAYRESAASSYLQIPPQIQFGIGGQPMGTKLEGLHRVFEGESPLKDPEHLMIAGWIALELAARQARTGADSTRYAKKAEQYFLHTAKLPPINIFNIEFAGRAKMALLTTSHLHQPANEESAHENYGLYANILSDLLKQRPNNSSPDLPTWIGLLSEVTTMALLSRGSVVTLPGPYRHDLSHTIMKPKLLYDAAVWLPSSTPPLLYSPYRKIQIKTSLSQARASLYDDSITMLGLTNHIRPEYHQPVDVILDIFAELAGKIKREGEERLTRVQNKLTKKVMHQTVRTHATTFHRRGRARP